jgi:hypothetical protein
MVNGEKVGKYWFSPLIPDEVKDSCRGALLANEALIPAWCNEVRVYWDSEGASTDHGEGSAAAYMEASYSYRYASITICPPFLSEEEPDKESRVRHELCHIVSYPILFYIKSVVETLTGEDETIATLVKKELSEKIESLTEDLAQIIFAMENKFKKSSNK